MHFSHYFEFISIVDIGFKASKFKTCLLQIVTAAATFRGYLRIKYKYAHVYSFGVT